ncbi:MAG: hypothetical protein AAF939_13320 [Planctomycetota bacterium]
MKNLLCATLCLGVIIVTTGCATTSCSPNGRLFQNQPIRNAFRSLFTQGDACDTCNAPAGYSTVPNVAPLCDTCGQTVDGGIVNYGQPVLTSPQITGPAIETGPISGSDTRPTPPDF